MNYFAINVGNFTTLIVKADKSVSQLVRMFEQSLGLMARGRVYNLKNYESIDILDDPSDKQKRLALTLESLIQ